MVVIFKAVGLQSSPLSVVVHPSNMLFSLHSLSFLSIYLSITHPPNTPVWPDVKIKSSPISPKNVSKSIHSILCFRSDVFKMAQISPKSVSKSIQSILCSKSGVFKMARISPNIWLIL